jgi:hypothetical protein
VKFCDERYANLIQEFPIRMNAIPPNEDVTLNTKNAAMFGAKAVPRLVTKKMTAADIVT